jgi:hypothetical protein
MNTEVRCPGTCGSAKPAAFSPELWHGPRPQFLAFEVFEQCITFVLARKGVPISSFVTQLGRMSLTSYLEPCNVAPLFLDQQRMDGENNAETLYLSLDTIYLRNKCWCIFVSDVS